MILGLPRAKQGLCHPKHGGAGGIILWALLTVFLVFFLHFFRKLLYNVGAETGGFELNALKTQLSSMEVRKRDLDKILDVWDCLDLMEERLEDGELISLLKRVYRDDDKLPGLLGDYTRGTCISNTTHAYKNKCYLWTCIDMQYDAIYGILDTFSKLEKVQF